MSWFGVVVSVMIDEPSTRYIRRRPIKKARLRPSAVIFRNPSRKISRPSVRNRLKLTLISSRKTIAFSPFTMNLKGTFESLTTRVKNSVAIR